MAKDSNDGCINAVGVVITFIIIAIAAIPKEVWIFIGAMAGIAIVLGFVAKLISAFHEGREEAQVAEESKQVAQAAAKKEQQEERVSQEKQERIQNLGAKNADLVESARIAAKQVAATEAARDGWLGDVDFTPDLDSITDSFQKAHSLRRLASQLTALDKPSVDDRKILTEAKKTASELERVACERVQLIAKCAAEARRIDQSLRTEREDAKTAEQRAKLHGKLSTMLYGIEAAPLASPDDSAAGAVMARVQAYRDIKDQIQRARDDGIR